MRVFISYAREDQTVAESWASKLKQNNQVVWFDLEMLAGRPHNEEVERRLRDADRVVVLWSKSSIKRDWVEAEATYALRAGKLVQFYIDDTMPEALPLLFRHITVVRIPDLDAGLGRVLQAIVDPRPRDLTSPQYRPNLLSTLVVTMERSPNDASHRGDLYEHVADVLRDEQRRHRILNAAVQLHKSNTPLPKGLLGIAERDLTAVDEPARLGIETCFVDWDVFQLAVEQVCRSDIVVFDITDLQPGIMLLLGIRAVARKGVTVCSIGGNYELGYDAALPFNLQMINVCAHSARAFETGQPIDVIGDKIENGLRDLAHMPEYLDLPAYRAVRERSSSAPAASAERREIPIGQGILMLGPFDPAYNRRNWQMKLSVRFPATVAAFLRARPELAMAAEARPDPAKAGDFLRPRLTRLLERSSARLVTQTFYEAIRNYQLAVVDWTSLRPNVLFEVGVRLATSRRPPIHIIERDNGLQDLPAAGLTHTQNLIRLMSPIRYPLVGPEERCYERILERYLVPEESERNQAQLYEIVARSVGDVQDDAARSVVDELTASARSLADESETSGEKSVLFHDANAELATRYSEAAFERRIAAWLYIDRRYSFAEIRENRALRRRYTGGLADEILAARHLRERASALLDYIKARVAEFERDEA